MSTGWVSGRRALVVGLGTSAMAGALGLHQIGRTPVIVERATSRRTSGYFVGLSGSGRAAAKRQPMTWVRRSPLSGSVLARLIQTSGVAQIKDRDIAAAA